MISKSSNIKRIPVDTKIKNFKLKSVVECGMIWLVKNFL